MRIPLDYYRILGLPLAASQEQLQQAYRDRLMQLPRREYSDAAITARKQLIEEAYSVLSDPERRSAYDERYLAQTYERDNSSAAKSTGDSRRAAVNSGTEPQTPSIDVAKEEFVGALLILQELGEYELVLKLGRPYLSSRTGAKVAKPKASEKGELQSEPSIEYSDIVLTVALACLELGREQWQQGQYENTALSLETGQELLLREGLFPGVRGEIQGDLYKLRPYRILELLALPENHASDRRQGLELLQTVLQERGGIDGTGDDQSGLSIDDFLRFIQQLRSYLTAEEQHKLFAAESKRPSAVATYLAVYAMIARGFTQRFPALIRQAKQMLMALGKRQDVHLEQAVCALLLGQTEEASRALELSQEYEPLAFIRENSQGSPDLLPGLCLYGERWLQNEVFPHFRDLVNQQASLKDYFADEQVQSYLEGLPAETEDPNQWDVVSPHSVSYAATTNSHRSTEPSVGSHLGSNSFSETNGRSYVTPEFTDNYGDVSEVNYGDFESSGATYVDADADVTVLPNSDRIDVDTDYNPTSTYTSVAPSNFDNGTGVDNTPASRRRSRTKTTRKRRTGRFNSLESNTRLVWMVFAGLVGLVILGLLTTAVIGWIRSFQNQELMVQLDQPPLPIPGSNSNPLVADGPLTATSAEQLVETWLSAKSAALGPNHDVEALEQVLIGPALSQWRPIVERDKAENRHRQFKHNVQIESVKPSDNVPEGAVIEAKVNEVAEFYEGGELNQGKSYDETLRVRYVVVRVGGFWRIQEMARL